MIEDDFGNDWGKKFTSLNFFQKSKGASSQESYKSLEHHIKIETSGKFELAKITISGTDANEEAFLRVTTATPGSVLLVAAGSYVAGQDSAIMVYTSAKIVNRHDHGTIASPQDELNYHAKNFTVAFPYFIDSEMENTEEIIKYENDCLDAFQRRIIVQELIGCPVGGVALELINGGHGGYLSNRYLIKFALVVKKYKIHVILDEILTFGRCSTEFLLLTLEKPKEFVDCVTFITLGKFAEIGLLLQKSNFNFVNLKTELRRDYNLALSISRTQNILQAVKTTRPYFADKRADVLRYLNVEESASWGKNLLIFGNVAITKRRSGHKYRYLPLIPDPSNDNNNNYVKKMH